MANIIVRKLKKDAYKQLQMRAAKHGVSTEEEARQIICRAVLAPEQISAVFQKYFGDQNGIDLIMPSQCKLREPFSFNE